MKTWGDLYSDGYRLELIDGATIDIGFVAVSR